MPRSIRTRRKAAEARIARPDSADRNGSSPAPRKTGLRIVEAMPWGAHICLFYDSKDDLLDTCVPYFKAGLSADEFCVWAVSEPATEEDGARIATTGL
jgi:MEDS: MEthanogen/methylotroph, DcmR Sensory domain